MIVLPLAEMTKMARITKTCPDQNTSARPRRRTQKGSALLEGALVIMPLMAIGFALLDYPLAIFIQNTLRNAVREGIRYAITQQTGGSGQDAAIKTIVKQNSMGFLNDTLLNATPPGATISIQYYSNSSQTAVSGVGSNAAGNICVITATIQEAWMAPLWRSSGLLTFSASSSDVMEAPPGGVLPGR
jgi:Flp pilus assembly protein TadG